MGTDTGEQVERIADALRRVRLGIERIGDSLNASQGVGRMAHKANLELEPLLERLGEAPASEHARLIGGFVSGVKGVLVEPLRSKARQWTYELSAGRMLPNIEVDTFALGVVAAGEREPWARAIVGDLIMVCMIELDRGYRVLTREQVEAWGTTDDRVYSAARSMLFHKTREASASMKPVDGHPDVRTVRVGDGYDAMRAIVVTDLFFTDLDEGSFRFTMPHQDRLLFVDASQGEAGPALLAEATSSEFDGAQYPLSGEVYRLEYGRIIPAHGKRRGGSV